MEYLLSMMMMRLLKSLKCVIGEVHLNVGSYLSQVVEHCLETTHEVVHEPRRQVAAGRNKLLRTLA